MSEKTDYDVKFYENIEDGSRRSASAAIPHIRKLFPSVKSVVDFGCGSGVWLAEFQRSGVESIFGLDFGIGAEAHLAIASSVYQTANLGAPVSVDRRDLCISLEVAEHVAAEFAEVFVDNLTGAAGRILFSAAIPGQGGHHHINEQAPDYWISKFERRGYKCFDIVRPIIWEDRRICWWYRQNILIFLHEGLQAETESFSAMPAFDGAHLVHPELFHARHKRIENKNSSTGPGDQHHAQHMIDRLVKSAFWKVTKPIHFMSTAAKKINSYSKNNA